MEEGVFVEDERKGLSKLREMVWTFAEEKEGQRLEGGTEL